MIISTTPFRISFFGGGTDYPSWYREHGGEVLGTSIDKYCYVSARLLPPFFQHRIRIVYSAIELCTSVDQIKHPSAREVLRFLNIHNGIEVHHDADLPARAGIGSSSAFTVGLLNALNAHLGRIVSKRELVESAIHVEQKMIGERVGSQDQTLTAYGGFNHVKFHTSGDITVTPVTLPEGRLTELESHLMLFFTGISRIAAKVADKVIQEMPKHRSDLHSMQKMVPEAISLLAGKSDITEFGRMLHESWLLKRGLSSAVSSDTLDAFYERGRAAGAIGGKILGAGGGGFLLLFARPEDQERIRQAMAPLLHVPFRFENHGSHIIVYEPTDSRRRKYAST